MTDQHVTSILDDLTDCLETLSRECGNSGVTVPDKYLDLHYHTRDLAEAVDDRVSYKGDTAIGLQWLVETHTYDDALQTACHIEDQLNVDG